MIRLGIMGGTFDPPHWAHLLMAEEARVRFDLAKVLFIPAGQPPHKPGYAVSDAEDRFNMVALSIASNPCFEVSRVEIERKGLSYSVDTLAHLKGVYGPDSEMFFVIGADEALYLPKWHDADRLPSLARFLVAPRPGVDLSKLEQVLSANLFGAIEVLPMMELDLSSTGIRRRVAEGESIRYLVTDEVESYIRERGLYAEG